MSISSLGMPEIAEYKTLFSSSIFRVCSYHLLMWKKGKSNRGVSHTLKTASGTTVSYFQIYEPWGFEYESHL